MARTHWTLVPGWHQWTSNGNLLRLPASRRTAATPGIPTPAPAFSSASAPRRQERGPRNRKGTWKAAYFRLFCCSRHFFVLPSAVYSPTSILLLSALYHAPCFSKPPEHPPQPYAQGRDETRYDNEWYAQTTHTPRPGPFSAVSTTRRGLRARARSVCCVFVVCCRFLESGAEPCSMRLHFFLSLRS
jgi:hypothetical protein